MRLASSLPKSLKEEVFSTFCNGKGLPVLIIVPAVALSLSNKHRSCNNASSWRLTASLLHPGVQIEVINGSQQLAIAAFSATKVTSLAG